MQAKIFPLLGFWNNSKKVLVRLSILFVDLIRNTHFKFRVKVTLYLDICQLLDRIESLISEVLPQIKKKTLKQ